MDEVEGEIKDEAKDPTAMESDWESGSASAGTGAEPVSAFQLRVLSGRHTGAIMPLLPGRYTLGQDEDSDFIFLDDAFLGGQVIVDVTGAEPAIEATGLVKAVLDGRELIAGQPTPLPHYLPVEVGTTRFAIGPSQLPWPEPEVAKPELPEAVPADAGNPPVAGEEGQAPAVADGAPETIHAEVKTPKRASKTVRLLLFTGIAILAILGGLTAWWLYPRPPVDTTVDLRNILAELNLSETRVESGEGGLQLKGFLRTEAERDSLTKRLGVFPYPVHVELISAEEIHNTLQGVLDVYNLNCSLMVASKGKAVVTCFLENPGKSRELSESLRQAAPPQADLEIRLLPASDAYSFLNGLLSERILDHKVHPEVVQGRIGCVLVKGQMDDVDMEAWSEIRESFRSRFGVVLEERWTDRLSPVLQRFQNLSRALDAQIVGVTVGEMSYITLKRRRKYFEGARLGGLTLKSIQKDRLVLGLDNIEHNYYLKKETK
ncbi:MAG TPA: type III secretion system inner membrane ring subunit SctD [Fibrobacteria bacterium]|nr:type III secretion system inner membrane ring subunit SctD [Fibrobacteria bacterium]